MFDTRNGARLAMANSLVAALLLPGLSLSAPPIQSKDVVLRYVDAYNNHNVEQMMNLCAENVRWLTVMGDSVAVEADGKSMLQSTMKAHFEHSPTTRSTLLAVEGDGPMVVAIEKAMSGSDLSARSQCSASVYKLQNGLIESVWYFDVYACGKLD